MRKKDDTDKTIPEMAAEAARKSMRHLTGKDGRLNASGRKMARLLEEIMPADKVDEWGWDLSRKERAAIKRRAAEEKARKAAVAKARAQKAAATRARNKALAEVKPIEEEGKYSTFYEIVDAYRQQVEKFKTGGCDIHLINPLAREVKEKISTWDKQCHPELLQYFYYQYCEGCRDAMLERAKSPEAKSLLGAYWKKLLTPRVYPPWERPMDAPMPHWPRPSRRSSSR